jgi:hypothetical protein
MDLTPYVLAVEESLSAAAGAGDDGTRRTAAALAAALGPATRLAIMDALSELALEVGEALGDRTVELRLEAGQIRVAVSPSRVEDEAPAPTLDADAHGEPSRITLRLPEALKSQAEQAAALEGVSLNTWLTRAVQGRLRGDDHRPGASGNRVRGWVQG